MRDYEALAALLNSRLRTGFAWGANDCVSFAMDAAEAQTGRAYRVELGATWSTATSAARALAERGGLEAAVDAVLPRIAPAMAQRGDVGLVQIEGRSSLVVVEGELVCGPGEAGLVRLPRRQMAAAWSLDGALA